MRFLSVLRELSVASHCLHAQMGLATHPDFFPRHLYVLQAKSEEVRGTDEWAGKVKAVNKHIDVLRAAQDKKIDGTNSKIDALQAAQDKKINALQAAQDKKIDALQDEINSKIDALQAVQDKKIDEINKNMEKILEILMKE